MIVSIKPILLSAEWKHQRVSADVHRSVMPAVLREGVKEAGAGWFSVLTLGIVMG
jgi:hypothetical protein